MTGNGREIEFLRVASASAETAARFVRERIGIEPLTWLATPKRLLNGRTPLEACRTSEGYRRIAVLHALSLGLDSSPVCVEGIALDMLDAERPPAANGEREDEDLVQELYTATIVHEDERGTVHVFVATMAGSAEAVRRHLRSRVGGLLEDAAVVRLGFDWSEPVANAMVSAAMADIIMQAGEHPKSTIACGFDFHVEQRFV